MKMSKAYMALCTAALIATQPPSVMADFEYIGPTQGAVDSQARFEKLIVTGKGTFPLSVALTAIAGTNVVVDLGDDLDANQLITWRGGRTRAEILDEVFSELDAVWRYDLGRLVVRTAREIMLAKKYGQTVGNDNVSVKVLWKIKPGQTFRGVAHEWCRSAGCTAQFETPGDLRMEFAAEIEGSIEDALMTLVAAAVRQGWYLADPEIWDNDVVVFRERN